LHFALGYVYQQQEDWTKPSTRFRFNTVDAGLSDVHSRLAYLLYRATTATVHSGGPHRSQYRSPNARRTAFLGLGLYANAHTQRPSMLFTSLLPATPDSADVYYDLGITLRDKGEIDAAAPRTVRQLRSIRSCGKPTTTWQCCCIDMKSCDARLLNTSRPSAWRRKSRWYATI